MSKNIESDDIPRQLEAYQKILALMYSYHVGACIFFPFFLLIFDFLKQWVFLSHMTSLYRDMVCNMHVVAKIPRTIKFNILN
jgi:hypothetical protein